MSDANMDFTNGQSSQGPVANMLANSGKIDPGSMRPYIGEDGRAYMTTYKGGDPKKAESYQTVQVNSGTLRRDEWKQLDDAVVGVAETRLNGINDLVEKGLVYNLGNAMGTTVLESHDISDSLEADLTMDGITRARNDRVNYSTNYLPVPIIHVDYEINARVLAASRNMGNALDTTQAERASRKVSERLEKMLFTDETYTFGGGSIYSYVNFPDKNDVSLSKSWSDSGTTAAEVLADVIALKQKSIDELHYGPWMIYVPTAYETKLDEDYDVSGESTQTIRERILKIGGIQGIKVVDTLPDDHVVFVQMTPDVVRLVRGLGIQNVEWQQEGNMITKYKVMTIQVPQIRSDYNGKSGITLLA